jgi:hypothetical protein
VELAAGPGLQSQGSGRFCFARTPALLIDIAGLFTSTSAGLELFSSFYYGIPRKCRFYWGFLAWHRDC